jgi:hypothetical protein
LVPWTTGHSQLSGTSRARDREPALLHRQPARLRGPGHRALLRERRAGGRNDSRAHGRADRPSEIGCGAGRQTRPLASRASPEAEWRAGERRLDPPRRLALFGVATAAPTSASHTSSSSTSPTRQRRSATCGTWAACCAREAARCPRSRATRACTGPRSGGERTQTTPPALVGRGPKGQDHPAGWAPRVTGRAARRRRRGGHGRGAGRGSERSATLRSRPSRAAAPPPTGR